MKNEKRMQYLIAFLVSSVLLMEFLDLSIINTAVPTIARDFGISPILLKFSVASYYLSLAIFIPISGWCADKFGTKTIFLLSVGLFTAASILCGNAHSAPELTLFRFLQGIGGAFMNPVSRIVVLRTFLPKDLIRAQSIIFTPALVGTILGPFLGGIITQYLSWHWIFYINLPVGIFAIWGGSKLIKQYIMPVKNFDWLGFSIIAVGLLCITFYIEMLNHYDLVSKSLVMLVGSIGTLLVVLFIIYCLIKKNAIFDFSIFKINAFNVGFTTNIIFFMTHAAIMFMLPLMYQECFAYSPAKSGYLILPIAIACVFTRMIGKKLIDKLGFRTMLTLSSAILTVSMVLMGTISFSSNSSYIIIIETCYGAALIMSGSSTGALCYVNTPHLQISNATSFDLTFRQFFSSMGVGLASFFLLSFSNHFNINMFSEVGASIFHYTFFVLAVFGIIAFFNSFRLKQVMPL